MKNQFLEAGQIVNTHGIQGEVKIVPWCDSPEFLLQFGTLYLDGTPVRVRAARVHKGNVLAALEGVADVNAAMALKGKIVSIDRSGVVLPEGSKGELVFTSIDKEAFPLLRYRTRDICILKREKCSCGRTLVKMCKPMGRSDDMLIIRGVNVFPSQIETVLLNHGYPANYQIIVGRVKSTDTLDVQVEMTAEMFTDNVGEIERRQKQLVDGLRSMLGLAAKVTLVAPKSIVRSEGKAVRVIDNRKI